MPTYEFTCPDGHDFDKFFRSMASAPRVLACPVCGKPADRQMSAGAGLVFHGTGFYITDYGKDGKKDQREHGVPSAEHPHHRLTETHSGDGDTPAPASASANGKAPSSAAESPATESKPSSNGSKDSSKPVATPAAAVKESA